MGTAIQVLAFTFDYVGKVLIALVAILVHSRVTKEGRIDKVVLKSFKREIIIVMLSVVFLTAGFILHLVNLG